AAAALSDEPAAGFERAENAGEKRVVVVNPMKGGGGEDTVGDSVELEVSHVSGKDLDAIAELRRQKISGGVDHILGEATGQDFAWREALGEFCGEAAGAAAGVENGFVAAQLDAFEDLESPAKLRIGNGVVSGGVPLFALVGEHGSMMREVWAVRQTRH